MAATATHLTPAGLGALKSPPRETFTNYDNLPNDPVSFTGSGIGIRTGPGRADNFELTLGNQAIYIRLSASGQLEVKWNGRTHTSLSLNTSEPVIIGRSQFADLLDTVSWRHVRISWLPLENDEGRLILEDLDSRNGSTIRRAN